MLRRDFIKFATLLGASVGLPAAKPGTLWATAQFPDGIVPIQKDDALTITYRPQKDNVVMVFTFGDERVMIEAGEGNLTHSLRQEDLVWYDFQLDFQANAISDEDFIPKLKNSKQFDLDVTLRNFDTYRFRDCIWKYLEHDFSQGQFSITGMAPTEHHNERIHSTPRRTTRTPYT